MIVIVKAGTGMNRNKVGEFSGIIHDKAREEGRARFCKAWPLYLYFNLYSKLSGVSLKSIKQMPEMEYVELNICLLKGRVCQQEEAKYIQRDQLGAWEMLLMREDS